VQIHQDYDRPRYYQDDDKRGEQDQLRSSREADGKEETEVGGTEKMALAPAIDLATLWKTTAAFNLDREMIGTVRGQVGFVLRGYRHDD